jgi:hypothetical protein
MRRHHHERGCLKRVRSADQIERILDIVATRCHQDPMSSENSYRRDSTRNPLDVITTLKEEVGLRQCDHAHPAFREAVGHLGESIALDGREADAVACGETHVGTLASNGNEIEHGEHRRIEGLINMKIDRTIRVGD